MTIKQQDAPVRILHWGLMGGRGGIEMFIMNLYRKIDRDRVQFDFLDGHAHVQPFEEEINDLGGRVFHVLYTQKEAPFTANRRLLRFYREHQEIGGVHVHANFPYATPLKVAKQAGIELRVLHSHNSQGTPLPKDPVKRVLAKARALKVAHEIDACPSHYFACSNTAAEFMFPGKPYTWVRNGIDTAEYDYSPIDRARVRADLGIEDHTVVVGFCGRLREQKNPLFAVDVFAQYHRLNPDSVFVVVGNGELDEPMRGRVAESGLSDGAVRFLGGERSDVNRIYQAMDILLMPSRYEGLPLVLIEAQTAGLPCLVSQKVITEQVKVTDLVRFQSLEAAAQEWAAALDEMTERIPRRRGYQTEVSASGFDMSTTAATLADFYTEHAGRH
ncbi:glycosyltransferase [Bifidobacterium jacchi]|uniref:Glycosyltransferase family 1 protein n=1 Tax=Bifidobacterium jacchi TaxID=2490545 RepID=A0A5N5RKW2_9BIFI|nr:glycosyltransferase [Bifidobacterium jacchi]KAB5607411.1 glycosyltransferase family 1 protein [Bifidobacterium jacchi]